LLDVQLRECNDSTVHLVNLETFVYVAELGSYTAAARALEIPKSTVARRVERLEAELAVALVQRTGRVLSLTDDGRALFERCAVALREIHSVKYTIADSTARPTGKLTIALPVEASASAGLIELITAFSLRWPGVQVELRGARVNQTGLDLLEGGSDVVFQFSAEGLDQPRPVDVDYVISRRLGKIPMGLVASPKYLNVHGVPRSIADLQAHRCLTVAAPPYSTHWLLRDTANREEAVPLTPVMISNDPGALTALVLAGAGVTIMPYHASQPYVEQGLMQPVLERWSPQPLHLHLQWLRSRHLAPRVRAFVDHVQAHVGEVRWVLRSPD
jgi:LysR family transcriptional regulator, regulator for bpeEF and oprC